MLNLIVHTVSREDSEDSGVSDLPWRLSDSFMGLQTNGVQYSSAFPCLSIYFTPTWPIPNGAPITPMLLSARWEIPRREPARPLQRRPTFKRDVFILLKRRAIVRDMTIRKDDRVETEFRLVESLSNLANLGTTTTETLLLTTCRQQLIRKIPPPCNGQLSNMRPEDGLCVSRFATDCRFRGRTSLTSFANIRCWLLEV